MNLVATMASSVCKQCSKQKLKIGCTGDKFCTKCGWNAAMEIDNDYMKMQVERLERSEKHAQDAYIILQRDTKLLKLIIGPQKDIIYHNRGLLCYFASVIDLAIFSDSRMLAKTSLDLPEENKADMSIFVAWTYTGTVSLDVGYGGDDEDDDDDEGEFTATRLARLWMLGDKFWCPQFCNAVMSLLLESSVNDCLDAEVAEFIFNSTARTSKLWKLIEDTLQARGPFAQVLSDFHNPEDPSCMDYAERWQDCVHKGGAFVEACWLAGGLQNRDDSLLPHLMENRHKYFLNETREVEAKDWRKDTF